MQHRFISCYTIIDNDCDRHTHSVIFAKKHAFKIKRNWDRTCHFSGKQLALLMFRTRLSKKDTVLE